MFFLVWISHVVFSNQRIPKKHTVNPRLHLVGVYRGAMGCHSNLFQPHPTGTAATATDFLPWMISDDRALVCLSKQQGGRAVKTLMSLADLVCDITRDRGVTEVRVIDHTLSPKMQAREETIKTSYAAISSFPTVYTIICCVVYHCIIL